MDQPWLSKHYYANMQDFVLHMNELDVYKPG